MKIRVAYLIDTIASCTAGTEKQLLETIKRLDHERFEPILICLHNSSWLASNRIPCKTVILGYTGFVKPNFPQIILQLRSIMRREGIHILQTFFEDSIFVGFIAASLVRPRPIMVSSRRDIGLGEGTPWYHTLYRMALPIVNLRFERDRYEQ